MTYNVIDKDWILVRYLDGTSKYIGIRQAFCDAKIIKEIMPPVICGQRQYTVEFAQLVLLSTIVMAAYYKPHNRFAAKKDNYREVQLASGLNLQVIMDYLDEWYDRFDLFDEKHPWMQNIAYKSLTDKDMLKKNKVAKADTTFIATSNPFAPGANSVLSGFWRTYTSGHDYEHPIMHYQMTPRELAQALVYTPFYGSSSPGQYPVGLYSRAEVFISPSGRNLEEMILRHCFEIPQSTRPNTDDPDALYDRPRWEWDNEEECFLHPRSNFLANAFFNGIEMLASTTLNKDGYVSFVYCPTAPKSLHPFKDTEKYPAFNRETALRDAMLYNPYIVCHTKLQDKQTVFTSVRWSATREAGDLMLTVTRKLPDFQRAHILDCNQDAPGIRIIYRNYADKQRSVYQSQGKLEFPADVLRLMNEDNHAIATKFQEKYNALRTAMRAALRQAGSSSTEATSIGRDLSNTAFEEFIALLNELKEQGCECREELIQKHIQVLKRLALRVMDDEAERYHSIVQFNDAHQQLLYALAKI